MSDRELVTFDAAVMQWLNAVRAELQIIRERLGPVDSEKSIQQTLEDGFAQLAKAIGGAGGNGDIGNKLDRLFVHLSTLNNQQQLILEVIEGTDGPISNLIRKVNKSMATQEERLQAILAAIQNVKQMLADLKLNNPAIEDEITAIEKELAPAEEPPPTP
jgi:ABC-type transporter Mla subunit MlaD